MAVLDLVAERGALPFSEIADALTLPKSSAHALLRTMAGRGYLALDAERRYALGSRIWELAQAVPRVEDLRSLMKPLMDEVVPDEAARRLRGAELARLTVNTIVSVPKLLAELGRTRERGYAVDNEEFAIGLRCIAAPIRDLGGKPVAALSVSMPTPRYSRAAAANARAGLADAQVVAAAALGRWQGEWRG
jgi:IclR family KDG regulon transcriptional repressor